MVVKVSPSESFPARDSIEDPDSTKRGEDRADNRNRRGNWGGTLHNGFPYHESDHHRDPKEGCTRGLNPMTAATSPAAP